MRATSPSNATISSLRVLRLRDGLMLLAGFLATIVAVASRMLLLWGGAQVFQHVLWLI
jgi:hypothetical protein